MDLPALIELKLYKTKPCHIKSQSVVELCVLPAPVLALHRSLKHCRLETTEALLASSHLMTQLGPRSRIAPATNAIVESFFGLDFRKGALSPTYTVAGIHQTISLVCPVNF